jgi:hypothetical protein
MSERLQTALEALGCDAKKPSHHRHNLISAIALFAGVHGDAELESACDVELKNIRGADFDMLCRTADAIPIEYWAPKLADQFREAKTIWIIGTIGSGKTVLGKALLRAYQKSRVEVELADGRPSKLLSGIVIQTALSVENVIGETFRPVDSGVVILLKQREGRSAQRLLAALRDQSYNVDGILADDLMMLRDLDGYVISAKTNTRINLTPLERDSILNEHSIK